MGTPRYDILAVDIDGTLVDHTGKVHPRSIAAIAHARAAGMTVVLCTGRALIECRTVIAAIQQTDPVIVSGGSIVSDPVSGKTLERFSMERPLVDRITAHLLKHNHAALLLKDSHATGYDYTVISPRGPEALDPASRWWFDHMGVTCRFATSIDLDEHPEHTVRVGAYSANTPVDALATELHELFFTEVMLQHFTGVLLPQERRDQGIESVHIIELFNPLADKWQALSRLAQRMNIPLSRTAAIGDQTNDLTMIQNAGLGIAMANANPKVLAVAKKQVSRVEEGGVGEAIEMMLSGEW